MRSPEAIQEPKGGLRERKKQLLRQHLSDTATRLFLERGFAAVRVADIAQECGVSEATVFNYFETKEALVLDRLEMTMTSLPAGLATLDHAPIEAALILLANELRFMTTLLSSEEHQRDAANSILRFGDLIRAIPSLRAYMSDMMDQWVAVAAGVLAERVGLSPEDPEPQIAARALLGLWHVQAESLRKHLRNDSLDQVEGLVTEDVRRAARLIGAGLNSFDASTPRS
ncbi:MAG TPA: TetR family transcriptional regulator [Acidimicrobiales bacterium]